MELSSTIQTNTVSASGATSLRLLALWTMALAWPSTNAISISTAAWKRPGTPEVALRAAFQRKKQPSTPNKIEKNRESILKTEKSTISVCGLVCQCVKWRTIYSLADGACSSADIVYSSICYTFRAHQQRQPIHFQGRDQANQHGQPVQFRHQLGRCKKHPDTD